MAYLQDLHRVAWLSRADRLVQFVQGVALIEDPFSLRFSAPAGSVPLMCWHINLHLAPAGSFSFRPLSAHFLCDACNLPATRRHAASMWPLNAQSAAAMTGWAFRIQPDSASRPCWNTHTPKKKQKAKKHFENRPPRTREERLKAQSNCNCDRHDFQNC